MTAVLVGAVAVLIAVVALDWYDVEPGLDAVPAVRFHTLADTADRLEVPWLVPAYFDWLIWVLLIALIATGTLANAPIPGADALRVAGVVLGLAGAALTYYSLQEIKSYGDEGTYAFHHATVGVWFAMGGFLVAGLGAAIGPRRI
jgi:hypothetical protein